MPNALVIVVDGLSSSFVGPYGNTWINTPTANRLAARSLLFECAMAASNDVAAACRAMWHGRHALDSSAATGPRSLPSLASKRLATCLVTDDMDVADLQAAQDFEERIVLPTPPAVAATSSEETQTARLFASALAALEQIESPSLVWVHARGFGGPWDAPYDLRQQFADDEDPEPPTFIEPPSYQLAADYDPDLLLGLQQAYAAQIRVLDLCLGVLLDNVWSGPRAADTLIVLAATRGYPLGEHFQVGWQTPTLNAELLQIPLLVHMPGRDLGPVRSQSLAALTDVYTSVLNWLELPTPADPTWGRDLRSGARGLAVPNNWDREIAIGADTCAVRVPAWFATWHTDGQAKLYTKPDDRWEINDVADRRDDVVDQLRDVFANYRDAIEQNDRRQLQPLPAALVEMH